MTGDVGSPFWWRTSTGDVHVAFTSVAAGNLGTHVGSPDQAHANRAELARLLGADPRYLNQIHSNRVLDADVVTDQPATADAWVSSAGTALAILVADCLPVLLCGSDATGRVHTAAAHAGRVGLLSGILENTLAALHRRGAEAITAWIGPGACGSCYEVPGHMLEDAAQSRPAIASQTSWGSPALDLRAEAAAVLEAAGAAVVDVAGCTIEDPQLFSHRGAQRSAGPQGRIAGVIWC